MAISEGVSARTSLRWYSSGTMTSNTEDTAPGTDSAQILRRTTANVSFRRNPYQSAEIRSDKQIVDYRLGGGRVEGSIAGELSPASYFSIMEAVHRDTKVASFNADASDLTSVVSSNSGTFTFAGGNPVSLGFRVGDIIRFTNLAATANNSKNFVIKSFGGTTNRTVTVYPAPTTDAVADTSFTVTRVGTSTIVPSSSHVSRKAAIEIYNEDIDYARLFTECRFSGYRMSLPAEGMATFEAMLMGRGMSTYSGSSAPYFVSPAAATTTGVLAAANGLLLVSGTAVGTITGVDISMDLAASTQNVVGQNFPPEIFLGRANTTGTLNALLEDGTLITDFVNETEISALLYLTASEDAAAAAMTIYLPRIKLGSADVQISGEGASTISLPFQALKYNGSTAGVDATTIRIVDTEAT